MPTLRLKGLPHVVMEDDVYEGYLIPKDSVILPNIWYDFTRHKVRVSMMTLLRSTGYSTTIQRTIMILFRSSLKDI